MISATIKVAAPPSQGPALDFLVAGGWEEMSGIVIYGVSGDQAGLWSNPEPVSCC